MFSACSKIAFFEVKNLKSILKSFLEFSRISGFSQFRTLLFLIVSVALMLRFPFFFQFSTFTHGNLENNVIVLNLMLKIGIVCFNVFVCPKIVQSSQYVYFILFRFLHQFMLLYKFTLKNCKTRY